MVGFLVVGVPVGLLVVGLHVGAAVGAGAGQVIWSRRVLSMAGPPVTAPASPWATTWQ